SRRASSRSTPRRPWRPSRTGWRHTRRCPRRSRRPGWSRSAALSTCRTASARRNPPSVSCDPGLGSYQYVFEGTSVAASENGNQAFLKSMATAAPEIPAVTRTRAFEALYRRHVQDVYRYALALLRNPAYAEDVTQTTFMNAYRAYMRGEEPLKPQNWLIKIAHNAARTRYARASRRVKEVPLDDHVNQLAVPDEDKPDIREVLAALGRLPLNQRAALVMRELEGRTYAEIADTIGVSVPAVETLIFRARRSLRLKASAVRALAVVPVPSSLSQL